MYKVIDLMALCAPFRVSPRYLQQLRKDNLYCSIPGYFLVCS